MTQREQYKSRPDFRFCRWNRFLICFLTFRNVLPVQFIEIVCINFLSSPAGENKKLHYLLDTPSFSGYSVLALISSTEVSRLHGGPSGCNRLAFLFSTARISATWCLFNPAEMNRLRASGQASRSGTDAPCAASAKTEKPLRNFHGFGEASGFGSFAVRETVSLSPVRIRMGAYPLLSHSFSVRGWMVFQALQSGKP